MRANVMITLAGVVREDLHELRDTLAGPATREQPGKSQCRGRSTFHQR